MRQTSVGAFAQNETQWTPWLRTLAGVRVDGYRFDVDAGEPRELRHRQRRPRQPEGRRRRSDRGSGTEFYVNGGLGFHSNDARGATITVDPATGEPARPRDAAGARQGRRGRRPHRAHPAPADERWRCGR